jgi:hypothetical protein
MKPDESVQAFQNFVASRGVHLSTSTPREGIQAMLAFRARTRCAGCSDDRLLYQWGSYDWGDGKHFELNITRQFVEAELEDDDAISQLSLRYKYEPSTELDALGASNCWEDQAPELSQFILASAAFMAVADAKPVQIELNHFYV